MDQFIEEQFPETAVGERKRILNALAQLGVDSVEDFIHLTEDDLKDKVKVIHMRKLLRIAQNVAAEVEQEQNSLNFTQDISQLSNDDLQTDENKTSKKLAIATGILGSVTAIAAPLAVFAALFPPITAPIAVGVGVTAGIVAAATAGTGIATAVVTNRERESEAAGNENEKQDDEEKEKLG